jgi:hypothetical protein
MNKGKFPQDKKQQKQPFESHGNKPQWPGQNPNQNPSGGHPGQNPNKPQWPGQKDKR